jgi:hypothetical protein
MGAIGSGVSFGGKIWLITGGNPQPPVKSD